MTNAKILIVEDDESAAEATRDALIGFGYAVTGIATTRIEAVRAAVEGLPDVILMDVMLDEKLSGIEAAKEVQALRRVPIIFITAYVDDGILQQAQITDPFAYLVKPYHPRELFATIELALRKHADELRRDEFMEELRRSREELAVILEGVNDGVTVLDTQGKLVYANDAAARLIGYPSAKEMLDVPLGNVLRGFEIKHEDGTPFDVKDAPGYRALQGVRGASAVIRHTNRHSGNELFTTVRSNPVFDREGRVRLAISVFHDITEQRHSEERLGKEYEFRRAIENSVPSGIAVIDRDGVQTYVNPAFCRMVGWTESELTGKHAPFVYWPPEEMDAISKVFKNTFDDVAGDKGFELRFRRQSGARFHVFVVVTPLKNASGNVDGWLASVTDITDRKRVQDRHSFLSEAMTNMAGSLDYETTLDIVARLAVPNMADWCGLSILDESGQIRHVTEAIANPLETDSARELTSWLRDVANESAVEYVIKTGRSIVRPSGDTTDSPTGLPDLKWQRGPVASSTMVLPLAARGRTFGALTLVSTEPAKRYDAFDLDVASQLAHRAALAVDNSRLYQEALAEVNHRKRIERDLTEQAEQQSAIAALGQTALAATNLDALFNEAVRTIAETLHVEYSQILHMEPSSGELVLRAGFGWKDGSIGSETLSAEVGTEAGFALQSDTPIIVRDYPRENRFRVFPHLTDHGILTGLTTVIRGVDQNWGLLGVYSINAREFSPDSVRFLLSMASILAQSIERKRAEEGLRASQEKFSRFMTNLPGAAWIKDLEGRYVYANEEGCRIFQHLPSDLYGKTDDDIFPPETARQFKENDRKAKEGGTSIQSVESLLHADGIHRSLVSKFPILGVTGDPMFIGGVAVDITERLKAEESASHLAAIVESSDDAVIGKTLDGIITSWNRGAERLYGYEAGEVVGKSISVVVAPERLEEMPGILARVRDGQRVDHYETVRVRKDGKHIDVSTAISPIRNSEGEIVGVSTVSRDVTEQKRIKRALQESEERFRTMAESAPVMIWISGKDKRCSYFNKPWLEFTGRTIEQELGDGWAEGVHSDDLERCFTTYVKSFDARQEFQMEYRLRRHDGEYRWVIDHGIPTYASDEFMGFIGSCIDITERRQAEEDLRKAHHELEGRIRERTADLQRANEELRKREVQLSTAQQIVHLGSWEWDILSSRVSWSDEMYHICGLRPQEFDGTLESFLDRVHADDRQATLEQLQVAVTNREPVEFKTRIVRPDGSIRILQSQGRAITVGNREANSVIGAFLDVTERYRAEQKFRALLESAPDAMVIVNHDGHIMLVNEQTERLFGYSRSDLLGQPVEMLLPKRFHNAHGGHRLNYFLAPRSRPMGEGLELFGLHKNGAEFPVEISLSPLETEEGVLVSSAIRDITEQKRLRASLLEAEKARGADLRRYVHSVQRAQEEERQRIARELHDGLCQKLSGMKLNIEVISDDVRGQDRALFRRLKGFNKRCEEMITEVRRMSINLRPAVLDDFGLVTALKLLAREFSKQHKLPIKLEVDESKRIQLSPHLEIAFYRIAQEAFSNIIKHAQASRVTLAIEQKRQSVVLRIADNGHGLNMRELGASKNGQSGLGLIGMRERAQLLGGTFAIESITGRGTTIIVTIPSTSKALHEKTSPAHC